MLTVVAFFVLLGVLITVHEAGHFLVAKACGVRVITFSLGFGPRLFGFTRGETEYRISALPLGGYVRMFGDDSAEDIPLAEQHRAFLYQPFLKKTAIAAAGPVANLLLPVAVVFALFVGHERVPDAVVGTVIAGEPAARAGIAPGDRIVAINGNPIALFSELQELVGPRPGVPLHVTVERDHKKLDVEVTARAAPTPTIFDRHRTVGRVGLMSVIEEPRVAVEHKSPASRAGIKDLEKIVAVDGAPTRSRAELVASLDAAAAKGSATLEVVDGDNKKRTVTVTAGPVSDVPVAIDRFAVTADELAKDARVDATVVATAEAAAQAAHRFGLAPAEGRIGEVLDRTVASEKNLKADRDRIVAVDGKPLLTASDLENALKSDPDGVHVVGVLGSGARVLVFRMLPAPQRQLGGLKIMGVALLAAYGDGAMVDRVVGPAEGLRRAVQQTGATVVDVVRGIGLLFSGAVGIGAVSGPVGIARLSGESAEAGLDSFVTLMALISVNLAVINLMPIPVLDGGHITFFIIELFTRRRVTAETKRKALLVGIALVGLLFVVAFTNDMLGLFAP